MKKCCFIPCESFNVDEEYHCSKKQNNTCNYCNSIGREDVMKFMKEVKRDVSMLDSEILLHQSWANFFTSKALMSSDDRKLFKSVNGERVEYSLEEKQLDSLRVAESHIGFIRGLIDKKWEKFELLKILENEYDSFK